MPLVCWLKFFKTNVMISFLIIKNGYFTYKIPKNRSPWASFSGPFLCYEGFHLLHSSGLQEASISRASSMVWPSPLWIHFYGFQLLHHFWYSLIYQLSSSQRLFRFPPNHKFVHCFITCCRVGKTRICSIFSETCLLTCSGPRSMVLDA